jgi:hypothetical protein|tara:strand:+ start:6997 stop:7158 length:162 start_codon:yes stop_codon:yes gene_type:complete
MNKSHDFVSKSKKRMKQEREHKNGLDKNLPRSMPMNKALNHKKRMRKNGCEDN